MDAELDKASTIWKGLLTPGQMQELGIAQENQDKSNKRPRRKDSRASTTSGGAQSPMLTLMAKLLLKHEDTLNVLLQEHEFVLYMNPGEGSMVPVLLKTHQDWLAGPKTTSLRHVMALQVVDTLVERTEQLQQAPASADLFKECLRLHLIDANKEMPFLRWCPKTQQLLPNKEKGLPIGEVLHTLKGMQRILKDDTGITLRFHALAKLQSDTSGSRAIPFLWTVGARTNGELWNLMHGLSFHSIWQLVRTTLRPQDQRRSGLAKQLQKMM